jgi:hypothetical protein
LGEFAYCEDKEMSDDFDEKVLKIFPHIPVWNVGSIQQLRFYNPYLNQHVSMYVEIKRIFDENCNEHGHMRIKK